MQAFAPVVKKNWKEGLGIVMGGVGIGAAIGLVLGGATAFSRLNERATLNQHLTTNTRLPLTELMKDDAFTTKFARIVSFRSFDPMAFDTALYNANAVLKLRDKLYADYNKPDALVENIPMDAEQHRVQIHRALSAIEVIVTRDNGYMTRDFTEGAADVLAYTQNIIGNMDADVRDRRQRPMVN